MSKLFSGIGKGLKKIVKGVGKVFKKIVKSDAFKVVLIAAAIYTGGAALGAWGGTGAAGAGTAATAGTTAAQSAVAATPVATAGSTIAAAAPAAAEAVGAATTAAGSTGGIIGNAIKGIGGFIQKNPMASSMIFNAVAGATSPDEMDIMREQERIRRERWKNMSVPNSVGARPSGTPLYYQDGNPVYNAQGIINKGMKS